MSEMPFAPASLVRTARVMKSALVPLEMNVFCPEMM